MSALQNIQKSTSVQDSWLRCRINKGDRIFVCDREGCDNRPFPVTQSELDEAGGYIKCELCDYICEEMTNEESVS